MQLLAHPDPFALESGLMERIADVRRQDLFARVLVLVPTVRLAEHVQRRIAGRFGACLGVDVLHHRALVLRILEDLPGRAPRPASPRLLQALLARLLERMPANRLARFAGERPAVLPALLRTLTELREAALDAATVREWLGDGPEAALAEVYSGWVASLERSAARGLTDPPGLVAAALPGARDHASRYRAIFHHGAYELIGVHLELVRALDRAVPVTFLLPAEPGSPAWAYAEQFARRHLLPPSAPIERLPGDPTGPLGAALDALYREEARPHPLPPGIVQVRHAQGASDEVAAALHSALHHVEAGTPPHRVLVVARSLEPYALALEEGFENLGKETTPPRAIDGRVSPWTSSLSSPLRREPEVRDLLLLLRVVAEDFPRAATVELLRSPRLRQLPGQDGPRPRGDTVETWSRRAGIVGGLEEWRADLPAWAGIVRVADDAGEEEHHQARERARHRAMEAQRVVEALSALADRVRPAPRRWAEHAAIVARIVRRVLPGCGDRIPENGAVAALLGLLEEMRALQEQVGDDELIPFERMVEWLEQAVDAAPLAARATDQGGLRVLDAMQARGLTFDRVLWIGFQSGLFPRPPREDPFLPDAARRRLRDASGHPLPLRSEGEQEEHLLLALLLGSAREGIEISWQRSDEEGRPRSPSLALRELARVLLGRPDARALAADPSGRVRSHPRDRLQFLRDRFGLLSPEEDRLLLALESAGDPAAEDLLVARSRELGPGLAMLRATESPAPEDLRFDGRIGRDRAEAPSTMSVSALEQLGRCPLQYFFRRRLQVYALEEEAGPFELASREMGTRVHRILEAVYRELLQEGAFEAEDAQALPAEALRLLPAAWDREMEGLRARLRRRAPVLWSAEEERWRAALDAFVREDLPRIAGAGWRPASFEGTQVTPLRLGPGVDLAVRGRFDRMLESDEGMVVGDYKTSGNLERRVNPTEMLRGSALQVPLYRMLAGGEARVELLGVGPEYHADGRRAAAAERLAAFDGFENESAARGFRETLRTLLGCVTAGRFPMVRADAGHCTWCDYRRACRRSHPPTRHREDVAPDGADIRDLQRKRRDLPLLSQVRGGEP